MSFGGDFGARGGRGGGSPLSGWVICITGKMSRGTRKDVQGAILGAGGRVINTVGASCNLLISTPVEIQKGTVKVNTARGQGLPIVSEAWLEACLEEGDTVDPCDYSLVAAGAGAGPRRGPDAVHHGAANQTGVRFGSPDAEPAPPPTDRGNRLGGEPGNVPGGRGNPRMAALLAAERRMSIGSARGGRSEQLSARGRVCSACTFENDVANESCTMCGESLANARVSAAPAQRPDDSINLANGDSEDDEDDDEDMRRAIALSRAAAAQPALSSAASASAAYVAAFRLL
jgi:hypothetical protein